MHLPFLPRDWRSICIFPYWLLAVLLLVGVAAACFWGFKYWVADPYILSLIRGE